jgi:hypothetical protein
MTTYDIDDSSRAFALSIDVYSGRQWFIDNTPKHDLEMDAKTASEGGGDGFLAKWHAIMGCWLNTMRGHLNAIALLGDPDRAPFHALTAKNQSLGIEPEGYAFDYDIVRRPLTSLVYVYKRKGTCPGIIETVRMFTKWDATCVELGFNNCAGGASAVRTWDGISIVEYGAETAGGGNVFVMEVTSAEGAGRFRDIAKTWANDLWKDGSLRGQLGDIACIDTNVDDVVATLAPRGITTTVGASLVGASSFAAASLSGLVPGLTVQIISATETSPGSGVYASEIVEILSTTGPSTVNLHGVTLNAYPNGSKVTIGKSIFRRSIKATMTAAGQVTTDVDAKWTDHQWKGYKLRTGGVTHNIVDNDGTTITVDGAAPASGAYEIAWSFDGATPLARYKIGNGTHSTWFEPTYDIETRGTIYDPFNRLYSGPGTPLSGVFGPDDVAAFITTPVTVTKGRAQGMLGFVFDLDPAEPAPAVNEYVGYFLNPNQNQDQMFEILANDATTLTIAGAIDSLAVAGQYYYVLKPRDKVRFQRITRRLRKEFTDTDVRIRVLFV